jgi:predicted MFS family arabinose efflux permease
MIPKRVQPMHRQVLLLVTAQAFAQTASILVMTVAGLAGSQIAPAPYLATVPISAMILGTVVATVPASMWMARAGRRVGFITGALLGALGGLVAASGIVIRSFFVLLLGLFLIGTYQAFTLFYRFAAAEVSDDAFRPRAISLVLTGGVAAALLGPALADRGALLLERAYAGSFLMLSAVSLAAAGLLLGLRIPTPEPQVSQNQPRPLLDILRQPTFAVAMFGAATGGGVMVLAMTAMPLAMAQHHHSLSATTVVMQMHVLGMFLPSFFTGSLIARFGVLRVMFSGAVLLSAHVALSLSGTDFAAFASALALLGIGWNFLYVGGTTLLTDAYLPAERGRAQAANDLLIFVVGLASSLTAGVLLEIAGWRLMNAYLVPWLVGATIAVLWLGHIRRTAPSTIAGSSPIREETTG